MKIKSFSLIAYCLVLLFAVGGAQAATITVTEPSDSFNGSVCSLRDAIQSMNDGVDFGNCSHTGADYGTADTILLEAQTYTLSLLSTDEDNNQDGDLDICMGKNELLIQGQGPEQTIITAAFPTDQEDRIFDLNDCLDTVTFLALSISNGGRQDFLTDGAGIRAVDSVVTLQTVHLRDSRGNEGGGILNLGGEMTILQSRVEGNISSASGGGILNVDGALFVNESTFDNNSSPVGGAIHTGNNGDFVIYNSTISGNHAQPTILSGAGDAGLGGGIFAHVCNTNIIVNSTISGNDADIHGGGIYASGAVCEVGVPIDVPEGVFLFNSTVASNRASGNGGGIFFFLPEEPAGAGFPTDVPGVALQSTILADNEATTGPDCFNFINSYGFNLIEDQSSCFFFELRVAPNILGEDPQLGDLQDNGGPTFTQGIPQTSPAIDMGDDGTNGCDAPDFDAIKNSDDYTRQPLTRDQRGFPRPITVNTPNCDVGAFEFQVFDFAVAKDDGLDGEEIPVGTNFDYTITVTNNGPGTATAVTLDDSVPVEMTVVSVTPSQGACTAVGQVIGCDLGDLAVGETATILVSVTATEAGSFTNVVTVTLNNEFQGPLTETAQVTTVVLGGISVFGSGVHCGLQTGAVPSPGFAMTLGGMALTIFGIVFTLRHRASH